MKNILSSSFSASVSEETAACMNDLLEVGLDSITDEGLLKDIPLVSTAVSIYKIGSSIRERHYLKKLLNFIDEVNKKTASQENREKFKAKMHSDNPKREQELEYIMVIIDRYLSCQKVRMLARLYIAFLNEILDWNQLTMYAEVIDHLLPGDYNTLQRRDSFTVIEGDNNESIIRLASLGLITESNNHGSVFEDWGNGCFTITNASLDRFHRGEQFYYRTAFGSLLVDAINELDLYF